ncbi:MAG TPA: YchJ family metal-binding protein [Gammaproteobacteria bacterium]|jgi:SEC-C motif-containing protein|nr:YchJ family metal-binding protein [Gammaproteobacteria bacterium]
MMTTCPCGTTQSYQNCCGKFITGQQIPATPEELMRSRYTAYTKTNMVYIARTMLSPAADHFDAKTARTWAKKVRWRKLEVINTSIQDKTGFVEFIAHFYEGPQKHILHEISEFHLIAGVWFYVNGHRRVD